MPLNADSCILSLYKDGCETGRLTDVFLLISRLLSEGNARKLDGSGKMASHVRRKRKKLSDAAKLFQFSTKLQPSHKKRKKRHQLALCNKQTKYDSAEEE